MCVNSLLLCAVWTWHSSQVVKQLETDKKTLEAKYQGERTEWSVKESAYKSREEEVTVQKQALEKKLSVRTRTCCRCACKLHVGDLHC